MAKLRILLVDDHAVVRRGVRSLIERHRGWMVVGEATTAAEGAAKAKKLKSDVILLDLGLPDVSGVEAINIVRRVRPEAQILVLTMHLSGGLASQVLAQGARGLVLKSDATSDLVHAVEAHRANLMRKLDLRSLSDLIHFAIRNRLIDV